MTQLQMTDERLVELARELPAVQPDPDRREAVRTSLLSAVDDRPEPRSRRWLYAGATLAVAAGVVLYLALARGRAAMLVTAQPAPTETAPTPAVAGAPAPAPPPLRRAVVEGSQSANFTHERRGGDEVVALKHGTLNVRVAEVQPSEHFSVVVGNARVEASASAFDVEAKDNGLRAVHVRSGRVTVRVKGQEAVFLAAGQSWRATEVVTQRLGMELPHASLKNSAKRNSSAASTTKASAGAAAAGVKRTARHMPSHTPAVEPSATTASPSPAEAAFKQAWQALQARRYRDAADGFARVVATAPYASIAPDARYWRAVALLRANDRVAGQAALESFLVQHPSSSRVGEVAAMLGWLHVNAGHPERARPYFKTALADSHARVRNSARAGLKAIGHKP